MTLSAVMVGLGPAIHVFDRTQKTWMPATGAGMTRQTLQFGMKVALSSLELAFSKLALLRSRFTRTQTALSNRKPKYTPLNKDGVPLNFVPIDPLIATRMLPLEPD